ncbi:guanine-1-methyltransferase-domain-containing protein [Trametes polyzona]|nr:guanine-1-methyltransferase-domain-containing protein [Trametes polyzona]
MADAPATTSVNVSDSASNPTPATPTASSTDPASVTASTSTDAPQPLSKKAQKKLAKAAYLAERKKERRAAEKERRKEKRRALAEKRAAGELDPEDEAELERERERKRQKTDKGPRTPFGARVVVDLGFDEKMTENEVKSLTSQLAYTYSANRKAEHPFSSLLFTSLNGRTLARMDATNNAAYKRWVGAEWWTDGYERLWENTPEATAASAEESREDESGGQPEDAQRHKKKQQQPSRAAQETVVYLTADADDELTELKEGETYIIGGIVDHNRYKNLCLDKSKEHRIRSARLPIGTYLSELRTRKVLTVNQTFEILLKWVETRDWEQALYSVMPKRKFNANGRRRGGGSSKGGESGAEGAENHGEGDSDGERESAEVEPRVIDVAALEDEDASALDPPEPEDKSMEVEDSVEK